MSSICGLISYKKRNLVIEDLLRLSHFNRLNTSYGYLFTHINKCGAFVGFSAPKRENAPNTVIFKGIRYTFVFDGVIHNAQEILQEIKAGIGYMPTQSDDFGGIAAWAYILWGGFSPQKLDGKFVYAIYSEGIFDCSAYSPKLFLARDKSGIKPMYFANINGDEIIFSSRILPILEHRKISARVDNYGLWQIAFLGGMSVPGKTLFKDIFELRAGACAYIDCRADGLCGVIQKTYFHLKPPASDKTHICNSFMPKAPPKYIEDSAEYMQSVTPDDLDECVVLSEMPYFSTSFNAIRSFAAKNDGVFNSRLGIDAYDFREGYIKSFFPWIKDPYEHIEFFNKDILSPCDGFNWLFEIFSQAKNEYTFEECDDISRKRIKMCLTNFINTPALLSLNEKIADCYSLNLKYPYAESEYFENIYYNLDICDLSKPSVLPSAVSQKNSELDRSLKCRLKEIVSNSEYEINNLIDKKRIAEMLDSGEFSKSLELIYLVHTWLEKFGICLDIKG